MKTQVYYRYMYGRIGIFSAVTLWANQQTDKRVGTTEWLKEFDKLSGKLIKNEEWMPCPQMEMKKCKFYFKKMGDKKFRNTLFKIHKQILNSKKINRKKFLCFEKNIKGRRFLYDFLNKRKLGKIVYEDKYQVAVI